MKIIFNIDSIILSPENQSEFYQIEFLKDECDSLKIEYECPLNNKNIKLFIRSRMIPLEDLEKEKLRMRKK